LVILLVILDDFALLGRRKIVVILPSPFEEVYSSIMLDFEFGKKYAATFS